MLTVTLGCLALGLGIGLIAATVELRKLREDLALERDTASRYRRLWEADLFQIRGSAPPPIVRSLEENRLRRLPPGGLYRESYFREHRGVERELLDTVE